MNEGILKLTKKKGGKLVKKKEKKLGQNKDKQIKLILQASDVQKSYL